MLCFLSPHEILKANLLKVVGTFCICRVPARASLPPTGHVIKDVERAAQTGMISEYQITVAGQLHEIRTKKTDRYR